MYAFLLFLVMHHFLLLQGSSTFLFASSITAPHDNHILLACIPQDHPWFGLCLCVVKPHSIIFNPMLFFCIISPIKLLGASIHPLLLTTVFFCEIHHFFPSFNPQPIIFAGWIWWIHSGSALRGIHGEPIAPPVGRTAPPRNADPRGPAPISGAPAAEAEGRAAGLGQGGVGGENSVPRPKWRAEQWRWAFCPCESPGEHQNSWYNDDKWVWVNTYRYITIVGWTSILTQLWLGVHQVPGFWPIPICCRCGLHGFGGMKIHWQIRLTMITLW